MDLRRGLLRLLLNMRRVDLSTDIGRRGSSLRQKTGQLLLATRVRDKIGAAERRDAGRHSLSFVGAASGWGLGVINADEPVFLGGFAGTPGSGGPQDPQTGA